jgi:hypothetical protein
MTSVMCSHWKKIYFGILGSFDYVFMQTHQTNENYININLTQKKSRNYSFDGFKMKSIKIKN